MSVQSSDYIISDDTYVVKHTLSQFRNSYKLALAIFDVKFHQSQNCIFVVLFKGLNFSQIDDTILLTI